MKRASDLVRRHWLSISTFLVTAIIVFVAGYFIVMLQMELDKANSEKAELQSEIEFLTGKVDRISNENTALHDRKRKMAQKLQRAKPWFELTKKQQENKLAEAALKAEKLERQQKKEQKAAKAAQKKEQLNNQKKLIYSAGYYQVGRDLKPGLYHAIAVEGNGNFIVQSPDALKVNEMFGTDSDDYIDTFKNIQLKKGDEIEINHDLSIQFIPR
ncbi:hypothetical protein E2R51_08190 [Jeotgalibacillus sp. S-D1]|uniref:hypothetical protein n=1 Tax=Jeotgalibacillus sp. S-D1 TaxID=2552189 RepID=UPI00105A92BA|nr:hypothetical protein [Jeotgalibacillus sp. S-D1]TDL32653.1 hypothetical protein E2R51_08190 [Jeotgalibacillus sp. S-D1]